ARALERRLQSRGNPGSGGWQAAGVEEVFAATGFDGHLGRTGIDHHDLCRIYQRPDRAAGIGAGLAASHPSPYSLLQHGGAVRQQHCAGVGAAGRAGGPGRIESPIRPAFAMAVRGAHSGVVIRCGPVPCVGATAGAGPIPGDKSEQFVFLRVDRGACAARHGRTGWAAARDPQDGQRDSAQEHPGRDGLLLALHGWTLGVLAVVAVDQALDAPTTGGLMSTTQAEMTMPSHPSASLMENPTFSIPAKKTAMWLFTIADTATFAGCLVDYGFLCNGTPNWPRPFHSITNLAIMTFNLLTSSLTMLNGVRAAKAGDKSGALRWPLITAALGVAFALLHIREWMALIDEGMTLWKNPWGTGLFGASFYSITGLHLTHVTGGVIALVAVGLRYKGGRYNADDLEVLGLYWHFVDLVWMFVVPLVYLLNLSH